MVGNPIESHFYHASISELHGLHELCLDNPRIIYQSSFLQEFFHKHHLIYTLFLHHCTSHLFLGQPCMLILHVFVEITESAIEDICSEKTCGSISIVATLCCFDYYERVDMIC